MLMCNQITRRNYNSHFVQIHPIHSHSRPDSSDRSMLRPRFSSRTRTVSYPSKLRKQLQSSAMAQLIPLGEQTGTSLTLGGSAILTLSSQGIRIAEEMMVFSQLVSDTAKKYPGAPDVSPTLGWGSG
jgi:hypothetical protein